MLKTNILHYYAKWKATVSYSIVLDIEVPKRKRKL